MSGLIFSIVSILVDFLFEVVGCLFHDSVAIVFLLVSLGLGIHGFFQLPILWHHYFILYFYAVNFQSPELIMIHAERL